MQSYDPDNEEFRRELGHTIRLLRMDQRLERQELAEAAGISYSYLSAIENGQKAPSFRLLFGLAERLGVRDDELLTMVRERLASGPPPRAAGAPPAPPAAAAPAPAGAPEVSAPRVARWRSKLQAAPERAVVAEPGPTPAGPVDPGELAELLAHLSPDDAQTVVDLARRLAERG